MRGVCRYQQDGKSDAKFQAGNQCVQNSHGGGGGGWAYSVDELSLLESKGWGRNKRQADTRAGRTFGVGVGMCVCVGGSAKRQNQICISNDDNSRERPARI